MRIENILADTIEHTAFARRLEEAFVWCAQFEKVSDFGSLPGNPENELGNLSSSNRHRLVEAMAVQRAQRLEQRPRVLRTAPSSADGRLLVYEPDQNLADGAAEGTSKGLFNLLDSPLSDTWVAWLEDEHAPLGLIAWIPASCVHLAQAGIDVSLYDLSWIDDSTDARVRLLHQFVARGPEVEDCRAGVRR